MGTVGLEKGCRIRARFFRFPVPAGSPIAFEDAIVQVRCIGQMLVLMGEGYRSGDVHEVACMAHIRRKFTDIFQSEGSVIAEEAIKRIARLYAVEKDARGSSPEERVRLRQARAAPIFDALEAWLQAQLPKISGKSELAKAIRYALTRMKRLRPYLDHGFLEIDNNSAERAMKPIAIGRKNYLFVGSEGGGKSAAIAYTLIQTAKLNGVNASTVRNVKCGNIDRLGRVVGV